MLGYIRTGVHQNFSITVPNILSLVNLFSPVTQISDLYISSLCSVGNQVTLKTSGKTRTPAVKEKKHQDQLLVNNCHLPITNFLRVTTTRGQI